MVVEADESDGTFLKLPAEVAIVTNVDPEHLDHFGTFDAVKRGFRAFLDNLPFYGFAAVCMDHPTAREIIGEIEDRRIIAYGEDERAEARLVGLDLTGGVGRFAVVMHDRDTGEETRIDDLVLPAAGRHNALNATAAIAVAHRLGVSADQIRAGLASFAGVKRRFTKTGEWNGVSIFDDYGHHPVEIAAVLRAARASTKGKVIAIMQPHRYTRLQSLFDQFAACFVDADVALIADVYAAGEAKIEGVDGAALARAATGLGHADARALSAPGDLPKIVAEVAAPGDYVVFLGAGDITKWAYALPAQLAEISR
jgi:UDP-N-acetylmuramate--alanine ligase